MKKILYLLLSCMGCVSCYNEDALKPSEEPELIYGKYTLPQGDHEYDDTIVAFYKKHGSLILYKFTSKDFGWSVKENVAWDEARDTVYRPVASNKYDARPADERYVGEQLKLLQEKMFVYLPDTLLFFLPQKILLCSTLDEVPVGLGRTPTPEERTPLQVYAGFCHIAVNWGNAGILSMSAAERNQFKKEVCFTCLGIINEKIDKPKDFFTISNYSDNLPEEEVYENGILDKEHRTNPEKDWLDYLKLAIENSSETLKAEEGMLNPSVDTRGKIRQKYNVMVDFFKSKYGFDIQAIGNDVE